MPLSGYPFKLESAAIFKSNFGSGHRVLEGAGYENLSGFCLGSDPCANMYSNASYSIFRHFTFA